MIGDRKRDDNKSGYRNISIKKTRTGATRYLIYVGYHGEKHTATRTNLADALVAREKKFGVSIGRIMLNIGNKSH